MRSQKTSVNSGGHFFQALKQIPFDLPLEPEVVSQPVNATKRGRASDLVGPNVPVLGILLFFLVP